MLKQIKAGLQGLIRLFGVEVRRDPSGRRFLARLVDPLGAEGSVDHIVFKRFFRFQKHGVFVEVGAARPDFLSVSSLFRKRGWRIIAIEPNPAFCDMHRVKGHKVLQYACGEYDKDDVEFSIVHTKNGSMVSNESFSSLSIKPGYRALQDELNIEVIRVDMRRLDSILQTHEPDVDRIDCLSIDTEGWELEVLNGFSLDRFRPKVMIIENLLDDQKYRDYMSARHYKLWRTIHPNEVYVRMKNDD